MNASVVRHVIWSCRRALQAACADTTRLGWSERLAPMLPTLRSALGPDYAVPAQSSAAAVDLVLAFLQSRFDGNDCCLPVQPPRADC
jgi:hypothetical protein